MYAIVEISGKQYKVQEGDIVFVDRLDLDEGEKVTFDKVLLISDDNKVTIGNNLVKDAKVEAVVIGNGKFKKILVYKYKAKKNERKMKGHRQPYTKIQVENIDYVGKPEKKEAEKVEKDQKEDTKKAEIVKEEKQEVKKVEKEPVQATKKRRTRTTKVAKKEEVKA